MAKIRVISIRARIWAMDMSIHNFILNAMLYCLICDIRWSGVVEQQIPKDEMFMSIYGNHSFSLLKFIMQFEFSWTMLGKSLNKLISSSWYFSCYHPQKNTIFFKFSVPSHFCLLIWHRFKYLVRLSITIILVNCLIVLKII